MAHFPDFSDSDSNFSDDLDYNDFKERIKHNNKTNITSKSHVETEVEKKEKQLKSLFSALSSGNLNGVTEHLNGLDVDINIQDGWTSLLLGVSYGKPDIVKELLKRGANANSERDGCTALMMACNCPKQTSPHNQSFEVIRELVKNGANVKSINRKRMTALMFAANNGHLPGIKYLLPLSDKDATDNQRWTALFWAVNSNEVEVVRYLLQEGFDYEIIDVRGNSPVDIAKQNDFAKIIELFPQEENDIISSIIDSHTYSFEEIFSKRKKGEKPRFFLDICNILCGVKGESLIKLFADKDIGLCEFLSISEAELENFGVKMAYQRCRILGGLYRFHKYPYHPKSLHIVPLKETYSNINIAVQVLSTIKQLIAMEASLVYIINNYRVLEDRKPTLEVMAKNVQNIRNKIIVCRMVASKLANKAKQLDAQIKPVDLITAKSRKYLIPWRKILFSFSVISLVVGFKIWK